MKQVTKEHWNGYDTYVLHSPELEVTMIPRLGNNIISVRDLKLDRDIVRRPGEEELAFYLQKPYHFGLPILIPPGTESAKDNSSLTVFPISLIGIRYQRQSYTRAAS